MNPPRVRVGFAGIGLMGQRMAPRLARAGHPLTLYNRTAARAASLAETLRAEGLDVAWAETSADLGRACTVVLTCLADADAVREVVEGMAPSLAPGSLVVDASSIDPTTTRSLAALLAERDVDFVDAPVSGGVRGAEAGTLAIMAGGSASAVERFAPMAAVLGRKLTHVGASGAGQVAKIANQMIVACNALVLAEAVALVEAEGIDAGKLPEALEGGFADSLPFRILVPRMAARRFEPVEWKVRTLAKDLKMAAALATNDGLALPMVDAARSRYAAHAERGLADADPSTLVNLITPDERAP